MSEKTKAAMLGRQWDHSNQNQHTRAAVGGQSLSAPVITGTAALAQLMWDNQSPENSGATICEIVGYPPESVMLVLHTSYRVAPMQLATPPKFWGNAEISRIFGRLIFNRCSDVIIRLNFAPADSKVFFRTLAYSLAFLRWRRLISLFTAVTINCAFVSPSTRLLSNSATMSCGKRALSCCDLLLVEPVAITESPSVWCDSVYAKKMTLKGLKCDSLGGSFKGKGAIHLVSAKPGGAPTPNRASDHKPLVGVTVMADQQHTQTRLKFTWRFLALNRHDKKAKPCRLSVEAATEREARSILAPHFILSLAARLPAPEVLS